MAELTVDDRAFLDGLTAALDAMAGGDGADFLAEMGEAVASTASARVKRRSGAVADGIGTRAGSTANGPWVEVGVINPPNDRHDFYLEFGTIKAPAQPFMRPALAAVAAGIKAAGAGTKRAGTATSRSVAKRSRQRRVIRVARRRDEITGAEAGQLGRQVRLQRRARRRR